MMWMRMPGQTWLEAAAAFVGMWDAMMVAMMLPSLVPMLRRYREAVATLDGAHLNRLTVLVAGGYLFVWTVIGLAVFPVGVWLSAIESLEPSVARAKPIAVGIAVLIAVGLHFTAWRRSHLTGCRESPGRGVTLPASALDAWRHGVRLGVNCSCSSAGPTAVLLAVGMTDLRAMAAMTVTVTAERLSPSGQRLAKTIGRKINRV